jgi:hypothetical protein
VTGGDPSSDSPARLIVDLTLAGLTLLSVYLGIRNLRRARTWANRFVTRPSWLLVLRLLPRLIPLVLLTTLPDLLGRLVGGGRDITFIQLCYYSTALVTWTAVSAVMNTSMLATRIVALSRLRRPAGGAPATDTSPQLATS